MSWEAKFSLYVEKNSKQIDPNMLDEIISTLRWMSLLLSSIRRLLQCTAWTLVHHTPYVLFESPGCSVTVLLHLWYIVIFLELSLSPSLTTPLGIPTTATTMSSGSPTVSSSNTSLRVTVGPTTTYRHVALNTNTINNINNLVIVRELLEGVMVVMESAMNINICGGRVVDR